MKVKNSLDEILYEHIVESLIMVIMRWDKT